MARRWRASITCLTPATAAAAHQQRTTRRTAAQAREMREIAYTARPRPHRRVEAMDDVALARATMGTSLAFHIVFAALGVGLPLLLVVVEGLALRRRDAVWMDLARRW